MNNVYLRKDGRWEGRIYAGSDNSGKRRYISFYGHTRESAEQKITDYLNENNKSFGLNFKELFAEWFEYMTGFIHFYTLIRPGKYAIIALVKPKTVCQFM